jgi:hypothetical protein
MAQAAAAIPSTAFISDRWRSGLAASEGAADRAVDADALADAMRVGRDGVGTMLASIDDCVTTTYQWRLAYPSDRLFAPCPPYGGALYPKIPRTFQERVGIYLACVDAATKILLVLGVDPKERSMSIGPEFESLATEIHEEADECPSITADTTTPSK